MPSPTGPSNVNVRKLARELWKTQKPIWRRVSRRLMKPKRSHRIEANLARLNKNTKEGDVVVIPGKVLGGGDLDHKITVASLKASQSAKEKLAQAECELIDIPTLLDRNPEGSGVKLFF